MVAFGDVIRYAHAPSSDPDGIGGDENTIWQCDWDNNRVYELSTVDLSAIRSAAGPSSDPDGIGGDENTIWDCDFYSKRVYELSTVDLSAIRSAAGPSLDPNGIGGDENTIWYCDWSSNRVYELSTVDLSAIRSAAGPSINPSGIGGTTNTIWHCDYTAGRVYELSTVDLSAIRSAAGPSSDPGGIGGDENTIWECDFGSKRVYELSTGVVTATINCPANGWCYLSSVAANTLAELDALYSTDVVQGYYDPVTKQYVSHRTGFNFNKDQSIISKQGYYYYFTEAQSVNITIPGSHTIDLKTGWNLVGNLGSDRTLTDLATSIGYVTAKSRYDRTLKMWVDDDLDTVKQGEAVMVYVSQNVTWTG